MPSIFVTQTFIAFSSRGVLIRYLINNFCSETAGLGEDYLHPDTGQNYRYFPSQVLGIFEASLAQIPRLSVVCFCHRQ